MTLKLPLFYLFLKNIVISEIFKFLVETNRCLQF